MASIDAETGRTVLIGLPRNLENFRFAEGSVMDEQFPDGFDCDGCYLNGVSTWAEDHTELYVRINALDTPYWQDDLAGVIAAIFVAYLFFR